MNCKHSWCLNPVISNGLCEAHKEIEALHKGLARESGEGSLKDDVIAAADRWFRSVELGFASSLRPDIARAEYMKERERLSVRVSEGRATDG